MSGWICINLFFRKALVCGFVILFYFPCVLLNFVLFLAGSEPEVSLWHAGIVEGVYFCAQFSSWI